MSLKEEELANLRRSAREYGRMRMAKNSSNHLKKIANKKFKTCFIAALVEFEAVFGLAIWGHGLSEDKLTEWQKTNRKSWEQVRKKILDKGNTQSRALSMEIDLYRVEFEGYKINLGEITNGQ